MEQHDALFEQLTDEILPCHDYIRQIAYGILKGNISRYPIFVALLQEHDIDLGMPVINPGEWDIRWAINASHLEDFVHKGIIHRDKAPQFIEHYKDPREFMCVFLADAAKPAFTFIPYRNNTQADKAVLN